MREIDVLTNMLNTAPPEIRQQLSSFNIRYGDVEVNKDSPAYFWVKANPKSAAILKTAQKDIQELRHEAKSRKDSLLSNFEERHAQLNINAVDRVLRTIDVPYKSNANLYKVAVAVPGHQYECTRGHNWGKSATWEIKVPVTYHHNVKKVAYNGIHQVTKQGAKYLNFITHYDREESPAQGINSFVCKTTAFCPDTGWLEHQTGHYVEQPFDDEMFYAFAYTEKRALSLLNKRVKAAMLEKLGVA